MSETRSTPPPWAWRDIAVPKPWPESIMVGVGIIASLAALVFTPTDGWGIPVRLIGPSLISVSALLIGQQFGYARGRLAEQRWMLEETRRLIDEQRAVMETVAQLGPFDIPAGGTLRIRGVVKPGPDGKPVVNITDQVIEDERRRN